MDPTRSPYHRIIRADVLLPHYCSYLANKLKQTVFTNSCCLPECVEGLHRSDASACMWPQPPQNVRCISSTFASTSSRPLKISWARSGRTFPGSIHTEFQPLVSVISSFQTAAQSPRGHPERRPKYQRSTLIWAPFLLLSVSTPSILHLPQNKTNLSTRGSMFFICYYMRVTASCLHVPALIKPKVFVFQHQDHLSGTRQQLSHI